MVHFTFTWEFHPSCIVSEDMATFRMSPNIHGIQFSSAVLSQRGNNYISMYQQMSGDRVQNDSGQIRIKEEEKKGFIMGHEDF